MTTYFASQGEQPAPLSAADIVRTLTDPADTIAAAMIVQAVNHNDATEAALKAALAALRAIREMATDDGIVQVCDAAISAI